MSRNTVAVVIRVWLCLPPAFLVVDRAARAQDDDSAGERLFRLHCAECHGLDGQGGQGPDLTKGAYRHGSTNQALYQTISQGVPGTRMPSTSLSDRQLLLIVKYVRGLAGVARVSVPGDPTAGEGLFARRGCRQCHMIRGEGGRLGPDLTSVGSLRSPANLRTSILSPDEQIDPAFWSVEAVDKDGKIYAGIRLNEDTYSIQILEINENLYSLSKNNLRAVKFDKKRSRMPAYDGMFTGSELENLVAYLYSLQRNAGDP